MDFEQRIAQASQYRDQTKASYDAAKNQTLSSQSNYDTAFNVAPQYSTAYQQSMDAYAQSEEFAQMKTSWEKTKSNVDMMKTMIDKLPQSVNQQFGGSMLTQAQRDMARQQQLDGLNKQFTQYSADYEVSFSNYNSSVDKAFDTALDVANKNYDSYWDGVRKKFTDWQASIENEKKWQTMYNTSESQLFSVQQEYRSWQNEQELLRMKREFEQWMTDFKTRQAQSNYNTAVANQRASEEAARKEQERQQRWITDRNAFSSGKLSTAEFMRRMDAGLYR